MPKFYQRPLAQRSFECMVFNWKPRTKSFKFTDPRICIEKSQIWQDLRMNLTIFICDSIQIYGFTDLQIYGLTNSVCEYMVFKVRWTAGRALWKTGLKSFSYIRIYWIHWWNSLTNSLMITFMITKFWRKLNNLWSITSMKNSSDQQKWIHLCIYIDDVI